jgi:hypothetical protein
LPTGNTLPDVTSDSRSEDDYGHEVQALLADAVRDEVAVAFGAQGIAVSDVVRNSVAEAITSRIDYGFRFRWDPEWAKGGPHQWAEDGRFYARCTVCLTVSPAEGDSDAAATWYRSHAQTSHDA